MGRSYRGRRLVLVYQSQRVGRHHRRRAVARYVLRLAAIAVPAVCATFSPPQREKRFAAPWVIIVEPAPR